MKIPRKNAFEAHIYEAFATGIEGPARRRQLRASGAPYCPILDLTRSTDPEIGDIFGTYFTTTGTAFHSTIQLFMAQADMGKHMWGNWTCPSCGHKWKHQFRPLRCEGERKCNAPPVYEEVSLRVGPHTGTCDFIARYGKPWVTNDFKTCARLPERPKRQHMLQVQLYNAMLEKELGIHIDAYFVTYFERTGLRWKAFGPYSTSKSKTKTMNWMFRAIKGFTTVTQFNKTGDLDDLRKIVNLRPCKSVADFEDYMARKEYTFNGKPCPLLGDCIKGDKHVFTVLKRGGKLDA